mgnify:CR=1 FL=1
MNTKVRIVVALWFLSLVNYLDRVAISFAGPSIMSSLAISPADFGIVLSSFGIGYALALIPGGMIADRWGARIVLVGRPVFWALFTGVTGFVTTMTTFVVVRVLFGFSEGIFSPSIYKVVGDNFDGKQRAGILAVILSALALGPALAGPLVGTLVSNYSWQIMFFCMAIPALLAAGLGYILLPRAAGADAGSDNAANIPSVAPGEGAGTEKLAFREVLKRPSLWLLSLSNLSTDIAQWGFNGWMPIYLAMGRGIDVKHAGMLGSIPYLCGFVGLLVGGWLGSTERLHRYRAQMTAMCYLAAGLSMFLAFNAETLTFAVIGLSLAGFFIYGALAPKGAVVIGLAPQEHRGAYVATYTTAGQIGGASAPAIIGFMVAASGNFASGFAFMIAALCIAAICMIALAPMLRRSLHEQAA